MIIRGEGGDVDLTGAQRVDPGVESSQGQEPFDHLAHAQTARAAILEHGAIFFDGAIFVSGAHFAAGLGQLAFNLALALFHFAVENLFHFTDFEFAVFVFDLLDRIAIGSCQYRHRQF